MAGYNCYWKTSYPRKGSEKNINILSCHLLIPILCNYQNMDFFLLRYIMLEFFFHFLCFADTKLYLHVIHIGFSEGILN